MLLTQAFRKKFVIPDFEDFTGHVDRIFEDAKELTGGKVRAKGMREGEGSGPESQCFSVLGLRIQWWMSRASKVEDIVSCVFIKVKRFSPAFKETYRD